jgi:hypothetical protein|tara:strand:- start:738 stop:962 length:225 start_codon:yes stop_codon:yes gene_type:complete
MVVKMKQSQNNNFWLFAIIGYFFSWIIRKNRNEKKPYKPSPSGRKTITYTPSPNKPYSPNDSKGEGEWTSDGSG